MLATVVAITGEKGQDNKGGIAPALHYFGTKATGHRHSDGRKRKLQLADGDEGSTTGIWIQKS